MDTPTEKRTLGPFSVSAIGLGAMQLTGPNVFGPPANRTEAISLLREAIEVGVDHIDTAQYYGPDIVNELIREALHPYPEQLVLVSKVGAGRDRRGGVIIEDRPEQLRRGIEANLRTLDVDTLPVVNLRLMRDTAPDAFFDDQLTAMIAARDDGLIGAVGLSNVTIGHVLHALQRTEVACVQNEFHLVNRTSHAVLEECTKRNIAFVPFVPLGSGSASVLRDPYVIDVARQMGCTAAQVALAWALAMSPNLLLIPGTSSVDHLRENLAASTVRLDADTVRRLSLMR